jgi:hypothetical protein
LEVDHGKRQLQRTPILCNFPTVKLKAIKSLEC